MEQCIWCRKKRTKKEYPMTAFDRLALHGALEALFSGQDDGRWFEAAQSVLEFALGIPESARTPMRSYEVGLTEGSVTSGMTPGQGLFSTSNDRTEYRERGVPQVARVGAYKIWRLRGMPFITIRHYKSDFPFIDYARVESFNEFWLFYDARLGAVALGEARYERKALRWWMLAAVHVTSLFRYLQLRCQQILQESGLEFQAVPFCFGVVACTVLRSALPGINEGDDLLSIAKKFRS